MRNLNVISDYKNVLLAYTKRQNKSLLHTEKYYIIKQQNNLGDTKSGNS